MPPLIEDKGIKLTNNTPDDHRDFQIAWLNRRVETLEAIVFELLRDRVHYEIVDGYRQTIENPGLTPNSNLLKDRGKQFAGLLREDFPAENLAWPPKK